MKNGTKKGRPVRSQRILVRVTREELMIVEAEQQHHESFSDTVRRLLLRGAAEATMLRRAVQA